MEFITAVRIAAALIFLTAAVGKMRNWRTFEGVVSNYRLLPGSLSRGVAWLLPPAELFLALALLFGAPGSELAAGALLSVFGAAMAINLLRGRTHIDCGCFDSTLKQTLRWSLVLRNAVLVLLLVAAADWRETAGLSDAATLLLGALGGAAFFIVVQCANVLTALPAKRRNDVTPMTVSQILLWAVVILQGLVILALARQVGVLHERVAPAGALINAGGPGVGEKSPRIEVHALAGNAITIGGELAPGRAALMLFVSASCPICKKLIPIAKDFAKSEKLDVLFIGDSDAAEQRKLIAQFDLDERRFVNGPEVGMTYRVDKLPYAVLLDDTGVIASKGLVNSREHFESLIVAKESGYSTIQAYLKARSEAA